jgi:hypothetical protein
MQTLGGFLLLPAFIYGYAHAGWLGGLTGFVTVLLMGSGVAIALGANVDAGRLGLLQRVGGMAVVPLAGIGLLYGGWSWGWLWVGGAYLLVMLGGVVVTAATFTRDELAG